MNLEKLKGKTLLIVDDEPDLRSPLVMEFESLGCKVFEANNGHEAFEIVKREKIDAVVSDIRMPGGDGIELLKNIKEVHHQFPMVLLISGFSDLSREDAYHLGAEAVLSKPFDLDQIDEAVLRILTPLSERSHFQETSPVTIRKIEKEFPDFATAAEAGEINLGRGGMFVSEAQERILANENVQLNLSFSAGELSHIKGTGVVRWVRRESTDQLPAGVGIEFETLSEHAQKILVQIADRAQTRPFIPKI
jgi:CheY-like chemotaxis protein